MSRFTVRLAAVLIIATPLLSTAQEKKKPLSDAEAYIQASIKTAQRDIDKYQAEIDSLQKLAKSRRLRRKKRVAKVEVLKDIKIYQDNIDLLKISLPTPLVLNENKLKVGDVGRIDADYDLKVIQVIDNDSMLVGIQEKVKKRARFIGIKQLAKEFQLSILSRKKTQYTVKQIFWLDGINTKGIITDQGIADTPGTYRVVGSATYKTLTGTNTVLKVKKLDMKAIQPHIDKWLAKRKRP